MAKDNTDEPVIIKKYANRRLYDTESSSYVTLEHLAKMTRAGRDFKVIEAKTNNDITHTILTQIIADEESRAGTTLLPVNFLRQIIAMYGDQMQAMVPHYLEASMEAFQRNQEQFRAAISGMMPTAPGGPLETLAKRNMAMMQTAADIWSKTGSLSPFGMANDKAGDDDVESLKKEVATLNAKLSKLLND